MLLNLFRKLWKTLPGGGGRGGGNKHTAADSSKNPSLEPTCEGLNPEDAVLV